VLYTHAEVFVFPSYYEGFGFPPLEAMQCGTPVIASDIASHRWVLGDAPVYCSPYDPASIAQAIERLVASGESAVLRRSAIARGHEQVKRYRPEVCARQWVALLERLRAKSADGNSGMLNRSETVLHRAA
jgi:glycosyltransferase involved in cell wall biosynthesis